MKKVLVLLSLLFLSTCALYSNVSDARGLHAANTQDNSAVPQLFTLVGGQKKTSRLSVAATQEQEIKVDVMNVRLDSAPRLLLPLLDGKVYESIQRETDGFERYAIDEYT